MNDAPLHLSVENDIAFLRLTAPPKNEMNYRFFQFFSRMCRDSLPGLDVRGMIIRGAGRHFSSGADVNELRNMIAHEHHHAHELLIENSASFQMIEQLPFPVVAIITGCCLGSGLELALCGNYRIASPNAVLGLPEVALGVIPGCGGCVRLPRVVGKAVALDMILMGKTMLAEDAIEIDLVDGVYHKSRLQEKAQELIALHPKEKGG